MLTSTNDSFGRKAGTYPVCGTLTYQNNLVQPKLLGASSRNPTNAARAIPSHTKIQRARSISSGKMSSLDLKREDPNGDTGALR
jgi:hypothetical protein